MVARWLRHGLWRPFELACRRSPLVPFQVSVAEPVAGVRVIRIDNAVTRLIGRIGGGYDYSVSYLAGDELLVDTGFPWAARPLRRTLGELGVTARLTHVVNTHSHEDHVGNNDVIAEVSSAQILVHPAAIPTVRWPAQVPWYRGFMFGPLTGSSSSRPCATAPDGRPPTPVPSPSSPAGCSPPTVPSTACRARRAGSRC